MQKLKEKIQEDGILLEGNIIKVDGFINHCMDIELFNEMGKEFKERFKDEKITKILTIEASGIGIAAIVSQYFGNVPVVFGKKLVGTNINEATYKEEVRSYTKNKTYTVEVSKRFLDKEDNVLIIDDFLARGQAALGLVSIARQAGAHVVGVGIAIEKGFQDGREQIQKHDVRVESLAIIDKIEKGIVYFK